MTTAAERLRAHLAGVRAALAREQAEAEQSLAAARAALAEQGDRAEQLRARLLAADPAGGVAADLVAAFAEAITRRATLLASVEGCAYRQLVLAEQARALRALETTLGDVLARLDEAAALDDWLAAQEREHARLATWLHDRVAQALHHLALQVAVVQRTWHEPARAATELAALPPLVENVLGAVRRAIFELHPMSLDDLGLVPTLERYVQLRAAEEGLVARLQLHGRPRRLPAATELALFRIVSAALDNVRDHAGTREALVALRFDHQVVELTVADGGQGCALDTVARADRGGGLREIRLRARQVGGQLTIESAPGHGLLVRVIVPHDTSQP
jgi:two-component system sensor histidine kinase DegS